MTNFNDVILLEAERYIDRYFRDFLPESRCFHNLNHTKGVVDACEMMVSAYHMSRPESDALCLAAWFHDTGYCNGRPNHEVDSVMIADTFLDDYVLPMGFRSVVNKLIESTRTLYGPTTLAEKIIRDADLHHIGSPNYAMFAQLLKQELEWADGIKYTNSEWTRNNIRFLEEHRFYTEYAIRLWEAQKQHNLQVLKELICE